MHPHNAAIFFALSAALAPGGIVLAAQQAATPAPAGASSATTNTPGATISVKTQLVNLPVIVRDKKGALVQNLTKADFALSVDGRPQTIRYFDKDNDLPLTLGLLVDISGSVRSELENERAASEAFLDEMMTTPANRAPDQAFLIQFAHETELLQDLTSSRPKLRAALDRVGEQTNDSGNNTSGGSGNSGNGGYGHHRGSHGGGTTLYDAVFLAGDELMQKQTGRKALVVLTDGEDRGSMETLAQAIRSAQRAETVVYAVYFKGERYGQRGGGGGWGGGGGGGWGGRRGGGFPGGGGGGGNRGGENQVDGKKILKQMTQETGGRMFEVSGKQTFAIIYTQIAEELRSRYRLGYTPDATTGAEGFHHVDLALTGDRKLTVQTRDGYYVSQ